MTPANPTWDLTHYFPNPNGPEIEAEVQELATLCERELEKAKQLASGTSLDGLEAYIQSHNQFLERMSTARSYLHCAAAADSSQAKVQKLESQLLQSYAEISKANSIVTQWIGGFDENELGSSGPEALAHEYALRRTHHFAQHQMSLEEESLAADLAPSAQSAWARFYGNYTSQIKVKVGGFNEPLSMSQTRGLSSDGNRAVRKAAYEAEIEAWKENATAVSTALNGVKGWALVVGERRKWESPLDEALYRSGIDRRTLDAMMGAARDAFPDLRRYLHAKAKCLGIGKCSFYDLFAPLPVREPRSWSYPDACSFVESQFDGFAPHMGDLARASYRENWIDVDPRSGKRDGAFCSGIVPGKSLVLMNFRPAYNSVSTLAHELGHAYHNQCLKDRTVLQCRIPMTLAETASTFCETICRKAAIAEGSETDSLAILESALQNSTQIVLDITSRFLFESELFAARAKSEVGPDELCALMQAAQEDTYGNGLNDDLHPYMWAAKPHYYGSNFYNFPYMFGLLFALGLYSIYQESGHDFVAKYDALLSKSGMASPAELAHEFGFDITKSAFWEQSMATILDDVNAFDKKSEAYFNSPAVV